VGSGLLESEPRIELRMPDHSDEGTSDLSKPSDTVLNELAADALPLIRRNNRHRPERCASDSAHHERAEHDMAHDPLVGHRDQREYNGASLTKRVDDSAFLLLLEGLAIHLPHGVGITRSLVSDLNHHVVFGFVPPPAFTFA
jgi:hypothetical protein